MRSVKSNFDKIQIKQKYLGAIPTLAMVIKDRKFTQDTITRAFTKLVPKSEYAISERRSIIKYLTNLSNPLEDNKIIVKNKLCGI